MTTKHCLGCFDPFTAKFIRSKVNKLIGRAGFAEADRADLLQEFALDLLQRRKNFDPGRATWEGFVVVVCENRYVTILEHRHADMRSAVHEAGSLNRPVKDKDGQRTEAGATMPESQQARRTGQHRRSHDEACDLAEDVVTVVNQMPPKMRDVCELLMRVSMAAAARQLGMSQGAIYEMRGRILARFENANLRDYLA